MLRIVVLCIMIVYFGEVNSDNFNDFMNKIPGWKSLSSSWEKIKEVIKRPVKIKRLGRLGRTKSTTKQPSQNAIRNDQILNTADQVQQPKVVRKLSSMSPNKMPNLRNYDMIPRAVNVLHYPERLMYTNKKAMSTRGWLPLKKITMSKNTKATLPMIEVIEDPELESARVTLPYIPGPVWKGREDWQFMQLPYFASKPSKYGNVRLEMNV